jgi:hypothetical protein
MNRDKPDQLPNAGRAAGVRVATLERRTVIVGQCQQRGGEFAWRVNEWL